MTGFSNPSSPSISTRTVSPGRKNRCGVRAAPTPSGVPVAVMSPGAGVITELIEAIRVATGKIIRVAYVFGAPANYHGKLTLIVDLVADFGEHDCLAGGDPGFATTHH